VLSLEAGVLGGRFHGRVHPDVQDACGDCRRRRRAEQVAQRAEEVTADVGDPQRRVAQRLELGGQRGRLAGVAVTKAVLQIPVPDSRGVMAASMPARRPGRMATSETPIHREP